MSQAWTQVLDVEGVRCLAERLGLCLRAGDLVALRGPVGAGKTTFARAVIAAFGGGEEVPSPTFALVETYEGGRLPLHHFDFYRLTEAGEVAELGLDDALRTGVALVEWPERAEAILPGDRLQIALSETAESDRRRVALEGKGTWAPRVSRLQHLSDFLDGTEWSGARVAFLQGDASSRAYARVEGARGRVILMDAPRQPDGPPIRDGKPYSTIAHLAEDSRSFVAVAGALREAGLSVPRIHAFDAEHGFILVEDLGDRLFGPELAKGASQAELYRAATDVLVRLARHAPPATLPLPDGSSVALPRYDFPAYEIETALLIDWLWPALHDGKPAPESIREEFARLWRPHLEAASEAADGWALRDFHSPNLLLLSEREGAGRIGLIDFQDAVVGPLAFDLVSLLQDARLDVPAELEAELLGHYCRARRAADSAFSEQDFRLLYAILGAQRNTKILGIFARLAKRDRKPGYLKHMPRIAEYLGRNLAHPALADLAAWYRRHLPSPDRYRTLGA